jgi:hypothetical protein
MTPFDATGHTNKDRPNSPKSSATCGARLPLLAAGVVYLCAEPVCRYDHLRVLHNTLMSAVLLEAGSIVNRQEDELATPERRKTAAVTAPATIKRRCPLSRPYCRPRDFDAAS